MRNVMIVANVVMAAFLAWPYVFETDMVKKRTPTVEDARHAVEAAAAMVAAVPSVKVVPRANAAAARQNTAPESCYKRFQREVKLCPEAPKGAGCKLGVADQWDLCEATGIWSD